MSNYLMKMIEKERQFLDAQLKRRESEITLPDDISLIPDIPYLPDGKTAHRMDIFRPAQSEDVLPVIVNVHGGGLLMGNKEQNRFFCAQLASYGFVIFSLEYSLVPDVRVQEQLAEVSAAMDVVNGLLEQYRGDRNRIYVVGDSAGAFLALYAVAMQKCSGLAAAAGTAASSLPVRALGLISGMFYTTRLDEIGIFLPKLFYGKDYKRSAYAPYVNPEHPDILKNLPSVFLMTSGKDKLRRYTLAMDKALGKAGVAHVLVDCGPDPKLEHVFSVLYPEWEESIEANRKLVEWLRKH